MPPRSDTVTLPRDIAARQANLAERTAEALGAAAEALERAAQESADVRAFARDQRAELEVSRVALQRAVARLDALSGSVPPPTPAVAAPVTLPPTALSAVLVRALDSGQVRVTLLLLALAAFVFALACAAVVGVDPSVPLELLHAP